MPRKPSNELFILVKSLSPSEWAAIWRSYWENEHNEYRKEKREKRAFKFIELVSRQESYDEDAIRKAFNLESNADKERKLFWSIKSSAESIIWDAFLRAGENQVPHSIIHSIPNLSDHLIERGAWSRARFLIEKYIKIAQRIEFFEIEDLLLGRLEFVYGSILPERNKLFQAEDIPDRCLRIIKIHSEYVEIRAFRETIKRTLKNGKDDLKAELGRFSKAKILNREHWESTRSHLICLDSRRLIFNRLGNHDKVVESLNAVLSLWRNNRDHFFGLDAFDLLLRSFLSLIILYLLKKEKKVASSLVQELRDVEKKVATNRQSAVQETLNLVELYISRSTLNIEQMKKSLEYSEKWYSTHPTFQAKKQFAIAAFFCAETAFLIKKYRKSVQWILKIKDSKVGLFRPDLEIAAYFLSIAVKLDQNDIMGFGNELKTLAKFIKQEHCEKKHFIELLALLKLLVKSKSPTSIISFLKEHQKEITRLYSSENAGRLNNLFNLGLWIRSKIEQKPYLEIVRIDSGKILG